VDAVADPRAAVASVIRIYATAELVAQAAAERMTEAAAAAIAKQGRVRFGLSGGTTPGAMYRLLGAASSDGRLDWSRAEIYFADERALAPDDPDSNHRLVRETLLAGAAIPPGHVHRMHAEAEDLEAAAAAYEAELRDPLDVLLLGMGPDGHTASLFPGSPLLAETRRRVAAVYDSPKLPARRLTVTPRVLAEAGTLLVLVTGDGKSRAVVRALEEPGGPEACPARLVRDREWFLDRAAASLLDASG
jgi:6-phosphogluconolactonase